ncbi:protease inhibitor 1-like isoform 2-T2 [Liasis olivaceus]
MKAVRGLLLLGLLALLAELPLSVGQNERCLLPADPGPCRGYIRRFFYNRDSHKCEQFIYGGCRGNANNFETLEECHFACEEKPGVCPQPPPDTVTICPVKCKSDWGCPGKQKCCRYVCMIDCMDPV